MAQSSLQAAAIRRMGKNEQHSWKPRNVKAEAAAISKRQGIPLEEANSILANENKKKKG